MTASPSQTWVPKHRTARAKVPMVCGIRYSPLYISLILNLGQPNEVAITSTNPPKSAAASGLVEGTLDGQDDDGDADEDDQAGADLNADCQTSNGE
jgi:hypothetical protein